MPTITAGLLNSSLQNPRTLGKIRKNQPYLDDARVNESFSFFHPSL
jgi:hypothetical protein